ncbi:MAG TPA: glycogen debranching N-terminal domain-containing protein [Caulobacteraceae bacterium]|nr:glycogen debranching N-terminal domain-containing protein [Caulobacteraceae bacterium]
MESGITQAGRGWSLNVCRPDAGRFVLFCGHMLLIVSERGAIEAGLTGLFFHRARFLSRLDFEIAGKAPELASMHPVDTASMLGYHLAPAPSRPGESAPGDAGSGEIRNHGLEVQTDVRLGETLAIAYRITNHGLWPIVAPLRWRAAADFLDQSAVKEGAGRSKKARREWRGNELRLVSPRPKLAHATRIAFSGPAPFHDAGAVSCEVRIEPRHSVEIRLDIAPEFDPGFAGELPRREGAGPDGWLEDCARLETAAAAPLAAWRRAVLDLAALRLDDGEGEERHTPSAGAPHYIGLFGRDALTVGWQTLLLNPATLRGSLSLVGRWTASAYQPRYDAQPGRVLHQRRLGPAELLGQTPYLHYYGDHTASGLWLLGLANAFAQNADAAFLGSFRDLALRILEWMDRDGDLDGDGFYEYQTFAPGGGLKNQGWKDSQDAILYPNGALAPDPLAVCEIQALFHAAKRALGFAWRAAGEAALGERLIGEADDLKRRFNERFWMPDLGYYALALDPDKRQVRTIADNAGLAIAYGVASPERARAVADRLMSDELFSGWGIRTLSTGHPAYNPLAYHLGSVWPSPNALTALGFARYGLDEHFLVLTRALLDAAGLFEFHRLPELFGGHARSDHAHPGLYPRACSPQAWSAGAVVSLIVALAGLQPAAPLGALICDPKLPEWLPELTLRGVPVGRGRMTVRVWRDGSGASHAEVGENSSGLRLLTLAERDGFSADDRRAAEFAAAIA